MEEPLPGWVWARKGPCAERSGVEAVLGEGGNSLLTSHVLFLPCRAPFPLQGKIVSPRSGPTMALFFTGT